MQAKPSSMVYWLRFALALFTGILCFSLRMRGMEGFSMMIFMYIISYLLVKHWFKYGQKELKGKNMAVMVGIGTYIFTWAAMWILLYTLMPYPMQVG